MSNEPAHALWLLEVFYVPQCQSFFVSRGISPRQRGRINPESPSSL